MNCLFIIQIALTLMMLSPAQCFVTLSNKQKRLAFSTNKRLQISSLEGDLCGKVLAKRFIYRLAPTKSTVSAPYAIEERQYFSIGTDNNLKPLGDKCFFIRADVKSESQSSPKSMKENAPNRSFMHIGSSLYQFKNAVKEKDSEDLDSCFVMALYCMANPNLTVGNVLEVGSGVGIGGILSCIGAGVASATSEASENSSAGEGGYHQSIEDIATESIDDEVDASSPSKLNAPISPRLTRLSLTDSSAQLLEKCDENVRKSSFPASKVDIYELDLKARAPDKMMAKFDCILGCDCAYYFPLVTPLARIVANSLRPSPYDRVDNTQKVIGQFIHICPEHEENIKHLVTKLSEGYKMNTKTETLTLERFDLVPLVLDSLEQEEKQLQEEVDGESNSYVAYNKKASYGYVSLVAFHHEDYDGINGDFFFPVSTGNEGNYGSEGTQRDIGYGRSGDDGRGRWLG